VEPPANPVNLFHSASDNRAPGTLAGLLDPFARSRAFWLVCLLSRGITILRETFNLWTPTYFTQTVGLTVADAAQKSALFPFFGGISVLLAGTLSDRLGKGGRATIILFGMLLSAVLLLLALVNFRGSQFVPVALVALVAFVMIGPYSYLAGAISLDFGGKQGSGTASGLIDGAGYLGGVLAGNSFARVSVIWGWQGAFAALAIVALLSSTAAGFYLTHQMRSES
jgi:sugar phosphate permease